MNDQATEEVTTMTAELLSDDQLAAMADAGHLAEALAEADRKDRRKGQRNRWREASAEWFDAAYAQYLAADAQCRGNLLSRKGIAEGIEDAMQLWRGPAAWALPRASEELRNFWLDNPRLTVTQYVTQQATARRIERAEMADTEEYEAPEPEPWAEPEEGPARNMPRHVTTYADIEPVDVEWVWDGRIPMGEVTLLVAKGGTGKTFAMTDIAARVTRGESMPDGTEGCPAGSVVFISGDDDPGAVLSWRIRAARAELGKVVDFSEPDGGPFTIGGKAACVRALHQLVAGLGDVRLVIIDPLARLAGVAITATKTINAEIMNPLRLMARRTGCAVVLVHHETKAGSVAGGQALWDSARSLLKVDAGEDGIRVITVEKSNMAEDQAEPVRYRLSGHTREDTHVEWLGENTPAALEGAPGQTAILRVLAQQGPMDAQALAGQTGMPYTSVRVLLTRLKAAGLTVNPRRGLWMVRPENVRVITDTEYAAERAAGVRFTAPVILPETGGES